MKQIITFLALATLIQTSISAQKGYWQQHVKYNMEIDMDAKSHQFKGEQELVYTNNSPDKLEYLWIQLDQNVRAEDSDSKLISVDKMENFRCHIAQLLE